MMVKLLGSYKNGNCSVMLFKDGTKLRYTPDDEFVIDFPESIDVKITNYCDLMCPYCHENSSKRGKHGDILNAAFIDSLHPFTEVAIGGGNPLSHPDLIEFLRKLKSNRIVANMTVNQSHFLSNLRVIRSLIEEDLINGLGVSLVNPTTEFITSVSAIPTAVIHVINGVVKISDLRSLYNQSENLKLLILGYKQFRRGVNYYSSDVEAAKKELYAALPELINKFEAVSFDNLALEQLNVKRLMSKAHWEQFYMGDDGQFTMYIDLVNNEFARCSVSDVRYPLKENILEMFQIVLGENN